MGANHDFDRLGTLASDLKDSSLLANMTDSEQSKKSLNCNIMQLSRDLYSKDSSVSPIIQTQIDSNQFFEIRTHP